MLCYCNTYYEKNTDQNLRRTSLMKAVMHAHQDMHLTNLNSA